jgi:hypothetical protein
MPQQKLTQTFAASSAMSNVQAHRLTNRFDRTTAVASTPVFEDWAYDFPVRRLMTITRRITNATIKTHRIKVIGSISGSFLFPSAEN